MGYNVRYRSHLVLTPAPSDEFIKAVKEYSCDVGKPGVWVLKRDGRLRIKQGKIHEKRYVDYFVESYKKFYADILSKHATRVEGGIVAVNDYGGIYKLTVFDDDIQDEFVDEEALATALGIKTHRAWRAVARARIRGV